MDANVCAQIEVQAELLSTSFEWTLKWLLARVHQLMSLEL